MPTTLQADAGQQLIFEMEGTALTPEIAAFVRAARPGGVVLFGRNLRTAAQARALIGALQDLAARLDLPPLLVAVDDEGGRVTRLPDDLRRLTLPSQMAQAVAGGPEAAAAAARLTAAHLRRLGFTINFAPVADVNSNPANPIIGVRSYGADPAAVAACVTAAVRAYAASGLACCAKHFPGHGDTTVDSHRGLPVVDKAPEALEREELRPFTAAIAAGVPAIMTAHIVYPQIDPDRPATLSPRLLRDLLRARMGFTGLIISDALSMGAIAGRMGLAEATRATLAAGACLLAPGRDLAAQYACHAALVAAAEAGVFDAPAEAARMAAHKARWVTPALAALQVPLDPAATAAAEAAETEAVAELAAAGLSVRDPAGLLPLGPSAAARPLLIDFVDPVGTEVEEGWQPGPLLTDALTARLPALRVIGLPARVAPEPAALAAAVAAVGGASAVILVTRNAFRHAAQAAAAQRLLAAAAGRPAVLVAAREPYDLRRFPDAPATVATYGDPPPTLEALAARLAG